MRMEEVAMLKRISIDTTSSTKHIVVNIAKSKTDQGENGFDFFINKYGNGKEYADFVLKWEKFSNKKWPRAERFFLYEQANNAGTPVGKNSITNLIKTICLVNGIDYEEKWPNTNRRMHTTHSIRRSVASNSAENGAQQEQIRLLGRWKSAGMLDHYVQETNTTKNATAGMVAGTLANLGDDDDDDDDDKDPSVVR